MPQGFSLYWLFICNDSIIWMKSFQFFLPDPDCDKLFTIKMHVIVVELVEAGVIIKIIGKKNKECFLLRIYK